MRCCVPFCENTSENVSRNKDITFHRIPDDRHLRVAWLRALGVQHTPLPDAAVVCSQHFLHDDTCETDSGSWQLHTDAVCSAVQVCMTCLDTDCKMLLMNEHQLDDAYEKLTGFPLCDGGNLKQTLCVQCAHRLRNFSRFRDMSLRARSLMMELVEQHQSITKKHIQMINSATNRLKHNFVTTTLGPDHCDLHIVHPDDIQPTLKETSVVVKTERSNDSILVEIDAEPPNETDSDANHVNIEVMMDPIKHESAPYTCTVCYEEFRHEHTYSAHVSMHQHRDIITHSTSPMVALIKIEHDEYATEGESNAANFAHTQGGGVFDVTPLSAGLVIKTENEDTSEEAYKNPKNSATVSSYDSISGHTAREDGQDAVEPAASTHSETQPAITSRACTFICDICEQVFFTYRKKFLYHMRTHIDQKPYSCPRKLCGYKCKRNDHLVRHMMTHTGEKPYTCDVCNFKCVQSGTLAKHMRTHNDVKPYSCTLCKYKSKRSYDLTRHMKIHTGEKPYSCNICDYKSSEKIKLKYHIRTHTGEKPYSCTMCDYKCVQSASLVKHVRIHKKKTARRQCRQK